MLKGASEVFSAVVAATLSLLSVLLPVSFLGGFIGRYLQQFSLGLAAAVAFSLLEAVLFLTVRLAYTPRIAGRSTWSDFVGELRSAVPRICAGGCAAWRRPLGVGSCSAWPSPLLLTRSPATSCPARDAGLPAGAGAPVLRRADRCSTLLEALTGTLHGWTEAGLDWVRDAYTRSLGRCMRRGVWVLAGSGLLSRR